MRAAALVPLLLLLAGCLGANQAPVGTPIQETTKAPAPERIPLPSTISFAAATVLGQVSFGAEPSIAAAPDGTVYVVTPLALWRSDDGGKAWKAIGNPACPLGLPACPGLEETQPDMKGGGDADIYVSPDGRAHWLGLADGTNAIPYQVSGDKGETWGEVTDLAGDDGGDREWITGRADGALFAAWRNFPPASANRPAQIVTRASFDGGSSWGPVVPVANDTRQGGVAVDPSSDALALAWDLAGKVWVAHSFDNGTSWTSVQVADDPLQGHVFPVAAFDNEGTLYAVYAHDRDGLPAGVNNRPLERPSVFLVVSHDKGLTWSDPVQVNAPGTTAWYPWLAAGAAGRLVAVWYQNDEGLPRQATATVYVMAGFSTDADMPSPTFAQVRVSPDPVHRGPECRENPGCTRSLLDFFEVAIHPQGYPVVAWAQDNWPVPQISVATTYLSEGPDLLH